jgi:hypothetical protein
MSKKEANEEVFEKLNDYTLSVVNDFVRMSEADPELRRIFNFKAQQVTSISTIWYGSAVSNVMDVRNFSDLDSLDEVQLMHAKLIEMEGKPPSLDRIVCKPKIVSPGQG